MIPIEQKAPPGDRTAAEWNHVAKATRRSKQSLQRCALGAVVDGCQGNRASARECANGTFFFIVESQKEPPLAALFGHNKVGQLIIRNSRWYLLSRW